MNNKILIAGIVAVMLCATIVIAPADAEDTGFDVTDGEGRTFHYDAPAERIVSTGAATTLTIAQAGAVSKIVAVDTYSTYDYTGYEELAAMDAVNLGSFYGETNHDYIVTSLINMVDNGEFSLDDTIILTSYSSNRALYDRLTGIGFTGKLCLAFFRLHEFLHELLGRTLGDVGAYFNRVVGFGKRIPVLIAYTVDELAPPRRYLLIQVPLELFLISGKLTGLFIAQKRSDGHGYSFGAGPTPR